MKWKTVLVGLIVLGALATPIAGTTRYVKLFHELSNTPMCHIPKELCTDGKSCPYLKLREHCKIHPWRYLQFREFRDGKELASNVLMDRELATSGKYDWESHKKDVAGREWNKK